MTLLTKGLLIAAFIIGIAFGISLLPSGAEYPLPTEIASAFALILGYLSAFNEIMPINTLITMVAVATTFKFAVYVVWPGILWIIKTTSRFI